MKIIKRDGSIVDYNSDKIRTAIGKANNEVSKKERATDKEINEIIDYIENHIANTIIIMVVTILSITIMINISRHEKLER